MYPLMLYIKKGMASPHGNLAQNALPEFKHKTTPD